MSSSLEKTWKISHVSLQCLQNSSLSAVLLHGESPTPLTHHIVVEDTDMDSHSHSCGRYQHGFEG